MGRKRNLLPNSFYQKVVPLFNIKDLSSISRRIADMYPRIIILIN
nr:MAG TPA: hypothetical protein [Bacteriophage sp.]DAT29087.1 MAG TPA: hypothetical protein [Caudoviricetes sp.]